MSYPCPLCCYCFSMDACYQLWTVTWYCPSGDYPDGYWSSPTTAGVNCFAYGDVPFTVWTLTSSTPGTSCTYSIWVYMGDCCTSEGDCTGLPDTPTPPLPASHTDCTCCANYCYQQWTAVWNCPSDSYPDGYWSGPTAGAKGCFAADSLPSTSWTQTSSTDTTCTYTIYVSMGPCCYSEGDCDGLDDTPPPDLPTDHSDCTCSCSCNDILSLTVSGLPTTWTCPDSSGCGVAFPSSIVINWTAFEGEDGCVYDGGAGDGTCLPNFWSMDCSIYSFDPLTNTWFLQITLQGNETGPTRAFYSMVSDVCTPNGTYTFTGYEPGFPDHCFTAPATLAVSL